MLFHFDTRIIFSLAVVVYETVPVCNLLPVWTAYLQRHHLSKAFDYDTM